MSTAITPAPHREGWGPVAAVVAALTLLVTVLLIAFAWPAARSTVHDVPIAVAGPAAAVDQTVTALEQRMPGAFDVTRVADTAAAEAAVQERDVYGAIDLSSGEPQVLEASAASPVVAQALQGVAAALAQDPGAGPAAGAVRDLVALPADDPRGAGLAAGTLPLVIGGMIAAVLLTQRVRGRGRRITGALVFAVTAGLSITAILQLWLGSLAGSYWINAGAVALAIAAISMTILGLETLLGSVGFGVGAVLMMLTGNPLSGTTSAPEMLPGWSGQLGQLLPPGAGGSLLRSTAFFDGHGAARPIVVLVTWLIAGAVLAAIGTAREGRRRALAVPDGAPQVPAATVA